jgi:hypothetical protein
LLLSKLSGQPNPVNAVGRRRLHSLSSVREVSIAGTKTARFLEVRAGKEKVMLNLLLFCNPAVLVALIRRQVPADRLKNI